jgi:hypothetical protein
VGLSHSAPASITLADLKGAVVYSKQGMGPVRLNIDGAGLNKGLYLMTVKSGNEMFSRRVLLK